MRLCFIWVKEYKGFENLSLNLSSDIDFQFDYEDCLLTKSDNENYFSGLYNSRIKDITAIVGKNGMGKSNCLELICSIAKGASRQFNVEYVSVMEHNDEFIISNTLDGNLHTNFIFTSTHLKGKIKGFNTIFFSNVYDNRFYDFSRDVINVTPRNNFGYGLYRGRSNRLNLFSSQIQLISKHKDSLEKYIQLEVPKSIYVETDITGIHQRKHKLPDLITAFRKRIHGLVIHEKKFLCTLKFNFLIKLLGEIEKRDLKFNFQSIIFEDNESTEFFLDEKIPLCINVLKESSSDIDEISNENKEIASQLSRDWESLNSIESKLELINPQLVPNRILIPGVMTYKITFDVDNFNHVRDLCQACSSIRGVKFIWDGISSGSNAFLNLLTVLHDELEGTRNDTLICIDEGDLYLHPAWQIDFINILNKMLPRFFTGNIQLVLTSHSPFLLTDLTRDNVIILHERKVLDKKEFPFKTFGSNLYELYKNVFFLNKKRFGSLAAEHIEDATNKIINGKLSLSEKEQLNKFIELIGDKLLHNQLKGMLNND
jgi:predicted ATPase